MALDQLFLDEDVPAPIGGLFIGGGFSIHTPRDLGTLSETDAFHLGQCAREGWVLITKNRRDFKRLHWLWTNLATWGVLPRSHGGILTVYGQVPRLPERLAPAVMEFLDGRATLEGEMHMWRPSTGDWEIQHPDFM